MNIIKLKKAKCEYNETEEIKINLTVDSLSLMNKRILWSVPLKRFALDHTGLINLYGRRNIKRLFAQRNWEK